MLLGNAPSSFYKYKYPKHWADKQGAKGAKVFIYKVKYPLFFLHNVLTYLHLGIHTASN